MDEQEIEVKNDELNNDSSTGVDSNPANKNDSEIEKLESVLKEIKPEDVKQFQRDLSKEIKTNLFDGAVSKIFEKYKPKETTDKNVEISNNDSELKKELLKTKISLELVKNGVSDEYMEEAIIVAEAKIKSDTELNEVSNIAKKFSALGNKTSAPPTRTGIAIGDKTENLTAGEKAVQFLRRRNPAGFK